jgi:hypothetical protein
LTFFPPGEKLAAMKNLRYAAIGFFAFPLALTFASNSFGADPIAPTEKMDLFNGKDFTGWTFFLRSNAEPANTFTVTNGLMHCTGQPYGYVRTEKSFRDYKLTVEWRFVKVAPRADNSGVIVHVQGPDTIWPRAVENQGQFHHQGDIILMGGVTRKDHGTNRPGSIRMQQPQNEKEAGEWNTYEVICSGDTLKNYVNGKLMNEIEGISVSAGTIAIQSEGGEWELRKAFIEPVK